MLDAISRLHRAVFNRSMEIKYQKILNLLNIRLIKDTDIFSPQFRENFLKERIIGITTFDPATSTHYVIVNPGANDEPEFTFLHELSHCILKHSIALILETDSQLREWKGHAFEYQAETLARKIASLMKVRFDEKKSLMYSSLHQVAAMGLYSPGVQDELIETGYKIFQIAMEIGYGPRFNQARDRNLEVALSTK